MNERVRRLREISLAGRPRISDERARLLTDFYSREEGKHSTPVLRALAFAHLCRHKTLYIGEGELIVGERGPAPLAVPTFPELTCHSGEDLRVLDSRPLTSYAVDAETQRTYEEVVAPYWQGRSLRDRIFPMLEPEWHEAYAAGVFTEFMEQRAPGHTVADDKIYRKGLRDLMEEIDAAEAALDFSSDGEAPEKREQLRAMRISAQANIHFAQRHAELAEQLAAETSDEARAAELREIARICRKVPARAPETFHEALQTYWFYHLGVITELNGWDSFNPGHLDHHLQPLLRTGNS
jgi:pyruvate-formate lyase